MRETQNLKNCYYYYCCCCYYYISIANYLPMVSSHDIHMGLLIIKCSQAVFGFFSQVLVQRWLSLCFLYISWISSLHCPSVSSWLFPIDVFYSSGACRFLMGQAMSMLAMLSIDCPLVQNTLEFITHLMILQGYCMTQVGHSNTISRLVAVHSVVSPLLSFMFRQPLVVPTFRGNNK